jgi:hypothetical protein
MPKHHVFLFRHCVRSTKKRERLHNNWTAIQLGTELHFETIDFVAEGLPDWQSPDYACTRVGAKAMERTGRQLFHEIVKDLRRDKHRRHKYQFDEKPQPIVIHFQLIADDSQRDVDSALALQRGFMGEVNNKTVNPDGASIVVKGLDEIDFYPDLFHSSRACPDKLSSSALFQDLVRKEIEIRLETVGTPTPDLWTTLTKLTDRGGSGRLGSLQDVPPWIPGPNDAESKVNSTSPFPVLIWDGEVYLAGPVNLISWMAELAFYSRASGVRLPFLHNLTFSELYQLVEFNHWSRTILSVENSIAARRGVVLGKAIIQALRHGHISVPGRQERSTFCTDDEKSQNVDAKVTLIVGHDGDIDSVATAFGLRWILPPPYHTSPGNRMGEYVPTPPGSALQFVTDTEARWVDLWYRFPISVERFDNTTAARIPKGMQMNASGLLESTPMVIKPRPASQLLYPRSVEKWGDLTRMIMTEDGLDVLHAQLEDTVVAFPESKECYQHMVSSDVAPTCALYPAASNSFWAGHNVPALMTYGLLLSLGGILYKLGYRLTREGARDRAEDRCTAGRPIGTSV